LTTFFTTTQEDSMFIKIKDIKTNRVLRVKDSHIKVYGYNYDGDVEITLNDGKIISDIPLKKLDNLLGQEEYTVAPLNKDIVVIKEHS